MEVSFGPYEGSVSDPKPSLSVRNEFGDEFRDLYDWSEEKKVFMDLNQTEIGLDNITVEAERQHLDN